jgi:hypothetical protein
MFPPRPVSKILATALNTSHYYVGTTQINTQSTK